MAQFTQLQFYLSRAAQARADLESATLENVRDRCRRSEEAWNKLAERAARAEKMREGHAATAALTAAAAAELEDIPEDASETAF